MRVVAVARVDQDLTQRHAVQQIFDADYLGCPAVAGYFVRGRVGWCLHGRQIVNYLQSSQV
ncbi:hypothetical protein GCM10011488_22220 [Steroidobacter agaridevorans]|nr:hypothetical protein GCM10011488_22220 [Steroidobacter agaridevorans]